MRKLSVFLLLPLLSLPLRASADLRTRIRVLTPRNLLRGDRSRSISKLVHWCLRAPRRLLTHAATEPEIQVMAAKAHSEATEATPPARRRPMRRMSVLVLPAAPRVRPQTT
jgi:hypothetical protein